MNKVEYILVLITTISILLLPFMYWLGMFIQDNKIRAWLSSNKFKGTDYEAWKKYIKDNYR